MNHLELAALFFRSRHLAAGPPDDGPPGGWIAVARMLGFLVLAYDAGSRNFSEEMNLPSEGFDTILPGNSTLQNAVSEAGTIAFSHDEAVDYSERIGQPPLSLRTAEVVTLELRAGFESLLALWKE